VIRDFGAGDIAGRGGSGWFEHEDRPAR
jgi:hypothetical protein